MSGEYVRVVQAAQHLDAIDTIPFVHLTDRIQRQHRCWLTFRESDDRSRLALCATKMVEFNYHDNKKERFYIPHHMLVVRPGRLNDMETRLAVGHQIGHIVLHFARYQTHLIDDPAAVLGQHGEIKNTDDEEVEATVFAALLCRRRSPMANGSVIPVDDLVREIGDILADRVNVEQGMKEQIIQGVEKSSQKLAAEEEQTVLRGDGTGGLPEVLRFIEQSSCTCHTDDAIRDAVRYLSAALRYQIQRYHGREQAEIKRATRVLQTAMDMPTDYARERLQTIVNAVQSLTFDE